MEILEKGDAQAWADEHGKKPGEELGGESHDEIVERATGGDTVCEKVV
jgi:hypothetical protein